MSLAAMALLGLNDHLFKGLWGNALTGKLSDLAGMVFFPLLLQGAHEVVAHSLGRTWGPSWKILVRACVLTGLGFGLVQIWPPATWAWSMGLGALQWPIRAGMAAVLGRPLPRLQGVETVADPTDLIAVPLVLVAAWIGRSRCTAHADEPRS